MPREKELPPLDPANAQQGIQAPPEIVSINEPPGSEVLAGEHQPGAASAPPTRLDPGGDHAEEPPIPPPEQVDEELHRRKQQHKK